MALSKQAGIGVAVGVCLLVIVIVAVLAWYFTKGCTDPSCFPNNGFDSGKVKFGDFVVLYNIFNQRFFPSFSTSGLMTFASAEPQNAIVVQIVNAKNSNAIGNAVKVNDKVQFLLPSDPQVTQLALGFDSSTQTIRVQPKTMTQTYFRIGSASSSQHSGKQILYNATDVTFAQSGDYGTTVGNCGIASGGKDVFVDGTVFCGKTADQNTVNWSLQHAP